MEHLYKLSFPIPKNVPHEVWLRFAKEFQRRRCLNIVNNDDSYDGTRAYHSNKLTYKPLAQ